VQVHLDEGRTCGIQRIARWVRGRPNRWCGPIPIWPRSDGRNRRRGNKAGRWLRRFRRHWFGVKVSVERNYLAVSEVSDIFGDIFRRSRTSRSAFFTSELF